MQIDYKTLKVLRDDVLLTLAPEQEVTSSLIYYKEDPDKNKGTLQYFTVLKTGDDCKHVKVGDLVVGDWKRITPPFNLGDNQKYGITSEKEILAILDVDN